MHVEVSNMKRKCRGSLKRAVLTAETDLHGVGADKKRKQRDHFGCSTADFREMF